MVNIATGDVGHRVAIEGTVKKPSDVAVRPGTMRPSTGGSAPTTATSRSTAGYDQAGQEEIHGAEPR